MPCILGHGGEGIPRGHTSESVDVPAAGQRAIADNKSIDRAVISITFRWGTNFIPD